MGVDSHKNSKVIIGIVPILLLSSNIEKERNNSGALKGAYRLTGR